jgi:hypothetical protein
MKQKMADENKIEDTNPVNINADNPASFGRVNRRSNAFAAPAEPKSWWMTSRRNVIIGGAAATGVLLGGGAYLAFRDDTTDVDQDSLALQQSQGWNVGSEDKELPPPSGQVELDSRGGTTWRDYLQPPMMLAAYGTKSDTWMPFFVPTLIQSLQFDTLRDQIMPISTPDMTEAYARGRAVGEDFIRNAENSRETALIVDLPGRDAVAFGAGVADAGRLVTTFDNFPHPLGVTPSHETLAAMLFYAGEVDAKQSSLNTDAPPVFLLDSNRLANYTDADSQFDNRYLAKLPSREKLQERGVKNVLYITPDRARTEELDDLNEDFVAYREGGLGVAMLPLSDFTPGETASDTGERRHHYGGHPMFLPFFFYSYPFYSPRAGFARGNAASLARPPLAPPRFTPVARPTLFSGTRVGGASGIGRSKPTGFGRSTVRVAASGRVVGTRAGRSGAYSPSRSGSFGRASGGSGGG